MDEKKELKVEELEKVAGGGDDFEPVELVFPIEKLRCKSCDTIFDITSKKQQPIEVFTSSWLLFFISVHT